MKTKFILAMMTLLMFAYFGETSSANQPEQDKSFKYSVNDNSWRESANERIEKFRKADFQINVIDNQGKAISNAQVNVKMTKHSFGFGALVGQTRWEGLPNTEVAQRNKDLVEKYFNKVVTIPTIQPSGDQMLYWFKERDIKVRGHYLMWARIQPGERKGQPKVMPADKNELRAQAFQYIKEMLTWSGTRVSEWDVINHITTSGHLGYDSLFGFQIFADVIKYAKEIAPHAVMGINDGGILWGDGPSMEEYYQVVQKLIKLNAKPDAVGFMSHFREEEFIAMGEIYKRLDKFAALVPHLQLTEFDIDVTDNQLQADYLRDVMTIAYSHPAIFGIIMWNVWGNNNKALWNQDGTIKPAGEAWIDLVYNQWWTNITGKTKRSGRFEGRGFLGDYEITVKLGDKIKTVKYQLVPGVSKIDFVL